MQVESGTGAVTRPANEDPSLMRRFRAGVTRLGQGRETSGPLASTAAEESVANARGHGPHVGGPGAAGAGYGGGQPTHDRDGA